MTDHEARILAQLDLIRFCYIYQVHEDEWEISLFGEENLHPDDCVVRQFGNFLMTDDMSNTQWFLSIEEAVAHLIKLGIERPIDLRPLWPAELAQIITNQTSD